MTGKAKGKFKPASRIFAFCLLLLVAGVVSLQIPPVQKAIADKLSDALSRKIDGSLKCREVIVLPFNALMLKDVCLTDPHPFISTDSTRLWPAVDTVFQAGTVTACIRLSSLLSGNGIALTRVHISDASFHLVTETESRRTRNGMAVMNNISRILKSNPDKPKKEKHGELLSIRKISLKNFKFTQYNYFKPYKRAPGDGIDWKHYSLTAGSLTIDGLRNADGHTTGHLRLGPVSESCGYVLDKVDCHFDVSAHEACLTDIHIADEQSFIELNHFTMSYDNPLSFLTFTDSVDMDADMLESHIGTATLNAFCGRNVFNDNTLYIHSCLFNGPVSDFTVRDLNLSDRRGGTNAKLGISICGLTVRQAATINGGIESMHFTPEGLMAFLSTFSRKGLKVSEKLGHSSYRLKCSLGGTLDRFDCDLKLSNGTGNAVADLKIRNLLDSKPLTIGGTVRINNIDAGEFMKKKVLGAVNLDTKLQCVLQKGNPCIYAERVHSDGFKAVGHDFNGLDGSLTFADHELSGVLNIDDPSLGFDFNGSLDFSKRGEPACDFFASIRHTDLSLFKFTRKHINLAADIAAGSGKFFISGAALSDSSFTQELGDMEISAAHRAREMEISVKSDILDMSYNGTEGVRTMLSDLAATSTGRALPSLSNPGSARYSGGDYRLSANLKHPRAVLSCFAPGLFFSDSTILNIGLVDGRLDGKLQSHRLASGPNYIKGITLTFDNASGNLNSVLGAEEIKIKKMLFLSPVMNLFAHSDSLSATVHYDVQQEGTESSDIFLTARFGRDRDGGLTIDAHTLPSGIMAGGKYWDIYDSDITLTDHVLHFNDLRMLSGDQFITVDGGISRTLKDTLSLRINELGLKLANKIADGNHDISGILNAYAIVTSPLQEEFTLLGKADVDTLRVGGKDIGALRASAVWDASAKKIEFLAKNLNGEDELLNLRGSYAPAGKDMAAALQLNGFELASISPFVDKIFSSMSGHINGEIGLEGHKGELNLTSTGTALDSVKVHLVATDAEWTIDGPFSMAGDTVKFENISVTDISGGRGSLNGGLILAGKHDNLIDLTVTLDKLGIMDKQAGGSGALYGKLAADCNAHIYGNLKGLKIEADAATSGPGNVHVSLAQSSGTKESDLLSFKERERYIDPYEALLKSLELKKSRSKSGGTAIKADIGINPEVEAIIELDKQGGNVLTASGTGRLRYEMDSDTGFSTLNGIYTLNSGKFRFSILNNLINKNFTIRNGGYIKFNGDIFNSDINVTADYTLKTSISPLISDTTSITTHKKVVCSLTISNKVSSPQISFSIDIPDLDPSTKSLVETALNTEDKIQKQFVSLLVTGNFIQDEQSGVYFSQSNILYKNLYDIVSGQLNNILQKLDIPLDLGLNYIESQTGQNAFDVAVSTQLFNNRVLVNGSFGNRKNNVTSSDTDMVGNIDIEIKIDKNGELRFTLFSHSPDSYNNWLDKSQRNGLGFSYQKEYSRLPELFKSIFMKKEEREQLEAERKREMMQNRKTIKVE